MTEASPAARRSGVLIEEMAQCDCDAEVVIWFGDINSVPHNQLRRAPPEAT